MILSSAKHARLAFALLKDAADAKLTLEQKRELQRKAELHKWLAKHADLQEHGVGKQPPLRDWKVRQDNKRQ